MNTIQQEIAMLLVPISPEAPAGVNIEYEQIYDDIRKARESDPDDLQQDKWGVVDPRRADWHKVIELCETVLTQMSKDLQVGCWFVEALTQLKGLAGAEAGLHFLGEFISRFWFQCWPALDEEGMVFRYGKLNRLDRDLSQTLGSFPLLQASESSLAHWRKVLAFEHKIAVSPKSRDALIAMEGDLTMDTFVRTAAGFSSIELSLQASILPGIYEKLDRLEECYFSLSQEEPHNLFSMTRQAIDSIKDFLQNLAQRISPVVDETITWSLTPETDVSSVNETPGLAFSNDTLSRDKAISQMLSIAHFFRQTEPSSPVPFLMERAVRWANMTLTEWLEEMLSDSSSLKEINNVLKGQNQ
ncbi:TPA: type VI secretion system protein TssA [Citrobacter koseri]|uniref:type VI secretion system protein TssA n=1 Tax=Citrobacter koseri TaxID=545 RepID=UPI00388DF833|nr:type VI secretion system protein TssA [Citrobacter koseri]